MKLQDDSPMPYGKFKGEPMGNVPAWYLLKLMANIESKTFPHHHDKAVLAYCKENIDVLDLEASQRKPRYESY